MLEEHVKEYVKDDADCMNVITLAESVETIQKELHKIKSIMSKQLKNTTDYISWSEDDWLSAINNFRYNCIVSLLQQFSTDILNDVDNKLFTDYDILTLKWFARKESYNEMMSYTSDPLWRLIIVNKLCMFMHICRKLNSTDRIVVNSSFESARITAYVNNN